MAAAPSQPQSQLALVSSLYGPGTISCWYLTTLSILVSWTLHPQKRKSGSIDVDLIAVLTLPAVAAGHLVFQCRGYLRQDRTLQASGSVYEKDLQSIAAIEAPWSVTVTFMAISLILFIIAMWTFCIRRAILVGLIGLLCLIGLLYFAVEGSFHFCFTDFGLPYRPGILVIEILLLILLLVLLILPLGTVISTALALYTLPPSKTALSGPRQDVEGSNEASPRARMAYGTPLRRDSAEVASRRSAIAIALSVTLGFLVSQQSSMSSSTSHPDCRSRNFFPRLFPRTACSITDLDQGVAAAAGATVLGFSVYSIAKVYYKIWSTRRTTPTELTDTELSRIENRPVS